MILDHAALILTALLKVFSLWFLGTSLFFWLRRKPIPRAAPKTRFACLIPARNEEAVVGASAARLLAQRYPRELFDVFVIPNNCTDGTEAAARAAGAKILRCTAPVRCKGDALRQAVARLPRRYDAYCVFDADNLADASFLARMNDAFCAGARVAKARMLAQNPCDSWVSGCYALYYGLFDTFYNRSRAALGLSARLVGTGFAVHREVLEKMGGWRTVTIAEDAEFSAMCAAAGERVWWVPGAVTYDEAPVSFRVSLTQRRRWCSGIMSAAEARVPELVRALPRTNLPRAVDSLLTLCAPFAQVLGVLPALLLAAAAAGRGSLGTFFAAAAPALLLSWGGTVLFAAVLARCIRVRDRRILRSVLLFPLFMASWLPLQIASLLRRTTGWKQIRHGRTSAAPALLYQAGRSA